MSLKFEKKNNFWETKEWIECITPNVLILTHIKLCLYLRCYFCNFLFYFTCFSVVERVIRYAIISKETWPEWRGDPRAGIKIIMNAVNMDSSEYQLGKTKIFIKTPESVNYFKLMMNFKTHTFNEREKWTWRNPFNNDVTCQNEIVYKTAVLAGRNERAALRPLRARHSKSILPLFCEATEAKTTGTSGR